MPRRRRRIVSRQCYEICFRAKEGLPFVAYDLIELLLNSILARVQRDDKVILCHYIWNGSHCHIIIVAQDAQQCVNFYGELKKKITDAVKRLLGLKYLTLWEGRTTVALIADVDAAVDRIAYLYANPAQDDLEECIERFPGCSSWKIFNNHLTTDVDSKSVRSFPWIRLHSIPTLNSKVLTRREDANLVRLLKNRNKKESSERIVYPNAWMTCFDVDTKEDVKKLNTRIMIAIRDKEHAARLKRDKLGKRVMGRKRLRSQPILKKHTPKKKSSKIFILASTKQVRMRFIKEFKEFCESCKNCYERWKLGDFQIQWPPGAFKPPLPPAYNVLEM